MTNQVPMQPQPMQPQPGMPMGQPVQPPETKSKLSMIALALCIVCCLIMLIGSYVSVSGLNFDDVTLENADKMLQAAQAAQNTQIIVFLIAGILNLVAFVLSIIGIVKSNPKTFAIVVLVVVLFLPGIAVWLSNVIVASTIGI